MNAKYKFRSIAIVVLAACLFTSCKKDQPLPLQPTLTKLLIEMDVNEKDTVYVSGGRAPFTISTADTSVAYGFLTGDVLVVEGKKVGVTSVSVIGSDGAKTDITVRIGDPFVLFKANDTLRFEMPTGSLVKNEVGGYHIYRDNGIMFGNTKYKVGWSSADAKDFFFLEFSGDPNNIGLKSNGTIYSRSGGNAPVRVNCQRVEVVQSQSGIVWVEYQEAEGKPKGRVVQKQWVTL